MALFDIKALSFTYPEQKSAVLNQINFTINEGEFVTVCGLSGSGKSTFLRCLKSSMTPYGDIEGEIIYKNQALSLVSEDKQAREIGFILQSPDNQTVTEKVWQELAFGLENSGMDRNEIKKRIAEMTACFDMYDWLDMSLSQLSGGQKQILNLASVILLHPEVLILDEPISGLDTVSAEKFIDLLVKVNCEFGTTVILCEHTLEYSFSVSSRIIVMDRGKIISDSVPEITSEFLWKNHHPMFNALPVSARIHYSLEPDSSNVPMNISSGRSELKKITQNKKLINIDRPKTDNNSPAVSIKNIYYRYEKKGTDIFKGLSMDAFYGEITAVLGANGTGKTTLLKNILGVTKPYSGKIQFYNKNSLNPVIAYCPQDPRALFAADSLEREMYEITSDTESIDNILRLFDLFDLRNRHPYDLSGGEQHKAALAKLLLMNPDILLLDEPVNGIDSKAKSQIGNILRYLSKNGICIIMISHDMDFCAEYSDKCTQLFDGELFNCIAPYNFFKDNMYFTTSARRLARGIINDAVTENDIKISLGINKAETENSEKDKGIMDIIKKNGAKHVKKRPKKKTFFSIISASLFLISAILFPIFSGISISVGINYVFTAVIGLIAISSFVSGIIIDRKEKSIELKKIRGQGLGTVFSIIILIFIIPLTIYIGTVYFNDSKYLFISILIMLECMIPFTVIFEKQKIKTREMVLICVMCALCVTARAAFYMLPQFKPMTAMIILTGAALGSETGFLVGAGTMLISNMIFGQGPWTPWQMFSMGLIGFISGCIFGIKHLRKTKYSFTLFGFFAALIIYGGIMDPAALIMSHGELNLTSILAYYITGLPLDIIHALSTAVFLFLASESILLKLERIKKKYGLTEIQKRTDFLELN